MPLYSYLAREKKEINNEMHSMDTRVVSIYMDVLE